jgi:hypothetical protein
MEQILQEIQSLKTEVHKINELLKNQENEKYFENWIPRKTVMQFLNYGDTQMAALLKEAELVVCTVGARKFIEKKSFLKFLENNIQK